MNQPDLSEAFLELVRLAATSLPPDVEEGLREAREHETPGSAGQGALDTILRNVEMARKNSYDFIHAHFIFPDGILAYLVSKFTGIPFVITTHGSDVPGYNPDRFILMHIISHQQWIIVTLHHSMTLSLMIHLQDQE